MTVSKHAVKATFGSAADTYNDNAIVQREVLLRLLAKLKLMSLDINTLLDLGSGTGAASEELQTQFGIESYVAMDLALPMLQYARLNATIPANKNVCGDAEALPFKDQSFNLVLSASTLQWCNNISTVFNDCLRVLRSKGLFIFSLFGPETLKELRSSFAQVDPYPRVKTFTDMHQLGDLLVQVGFHAPVMEMELLTLEYQHPMQLLRDLKSTGATNQLQNRCKGLLTKRQLNAALHAYEQYRLPNGKYPATYEIIYGHAWRGEVADQVSTDPGEWQPIQFK